MASKRPAITLCPPGAGPPERITPTRMGEDLVSPEPEEKLTAGRLKVFGKSFWISASALVGNAVLLAEEVAEREAGSFGWYLVRALARAV